MRRIGDWEKAGALVANLTKEMLAARDLSLKRFGLKAEGIAKQHISAQDLDWVELKKDTTDRKIRLGYSENILVETSTYFQSITSFVEGGDLVLIGVKKTAMADDGVTELADIAAVHEFGTQDAKIPARPLWQPTFEEAIEWHKKNNRAEDIFIARIKKYY